MECFPDCILLPKALSLIQLTVSYLQEMRELMLKQRHTYTELYK